MRVEIEAIESFQTTINLPFANYLKYISGTTISRSILYVKRLELIVVICINIQIGCFIEQARLYLFSREVKLLKVICLRLDTVRIFPDARL